MMQRSPRLAVFSALWVAMVVATFGPRPAAGAEGLDLPDTPQFNRDIRPILSDTCFTCHGPDPKTRKGKYRVDIQEGAFAQRDGYQLIARGQPDKSELYLRLISDDEDERMPHHRGGKTLTPRQIALVKRWIEQGAKWQAHWSFIPPTQAAAPRVKAKDIASPIDAFIAARLEREGLTFAAEADRRTLIRRLSFDLTGLPPTPAQVKAFIDDRSPGAYERLVDRLLASPQYGERMAVFWLDLVRYADSIGYHSDNPRSVWMYRDYVIGAFNRNLPYDQFTIEQLAGDLLPDPTLEQRVATGYNKLLQTTEEGGAQPKEYEAKNAADRVRNVGEVWMAATTGCAECHDHKFDPFSMKDFYSFAAFFADVKENPIGKRQHTPVPTPEHQAKIKAIDAQVAEVEESLNTSSPQLLAAQAKWEASLADKLENQGTSFGPWHAVGPFKAASFDQAHKTDFGPEKSETLDIRTSFKDGKLKWKRQPKWKDGQLINLTGDNSATYMARTITAPRAMPVDLSLGSDDGIRVWLNGDLVLDKLVSRAAAPDQEKVTLQLEPGDNHLLMKVSNGSGGYQFYFAVRGAGLPNNVVAILQLPAAERTDAHKAALAKYYRGIAPMLKPLRQKVPALKKERDALVKSQPQTLMTVAANPRMVRMLPRGDWLNESGDVMKPAVPGFLGAINVKERPANRLDLAKWLVRGDHPMVGRAFVNRLWKLYFGYGIARTVEDIGSQGEWPTHPLLLDWLAVEFVRAKWDVKHMVKLMVMSRAYRQSSVASAELRARDPYNRLYARQTAFRIDAEMVRDNALAVSGLLVKTIGGPSVKPYQPAGYWQHLNFPRRTWKQGQGEELYRRGMYTWWQRSFLHPSLLAFDATSREECTAQRPRSNTPQQALVLLNDPTYVEAARVFAQRILAQAGDDRAKLTWAYQQTLQRAPRDAESKLLIALRAKHLAAYKADPAAAQQLITVGAAPQAEGADPAELAAWTSVARVILNLHETITRN